MLKNQMAIIYIPICLLFFPPKIWDDDPSENSAGWNVEVRICYLNMLDKNIYVSNPNTHSLRFQPSIFADVYL